MILSMCPTKAVFLGFAGAEENLPASVELPFDQWMDTNAYDSAFFCTILGRCEEDYIGVLMFQRFHLVSCPVTHGERMGVHVEDKPAVDSDL